MKPVALAGIVCGVLWLGWCAAAQKPAVHAEVFEKLELAPGGRQVVKFTAPAVPKDQQAVLTLLARLAAPKPSGYTQALRLTLNDTRIEVSRLVNKPLEAKAKDGRVHRLAAIDRFTVYYAPDFVSADASTYGIEGVKTCEFALRVTDLLRPGENQLLIENACDPRVTRNLFAEQGRIILTTSAAASRPGSAPPTGELPVFMPAKPGTHRFQATEASGAKIVVKVGDQSITVASRFSTPAGKWEQASNSFFEHGRRIEKTGEAVVVHDSFRNLTDDNLPLMQRHEIEQPASKVFLGGLSPSAASANAGDPQNPSTFAVIGSAGLGLLPLNDEFQVHVANTVTKGIAALSDNSMVLAPRKSFTASWAIIPVSSNDYFDFVNAARRLLDANFTIDTCFAFLRGGPLTDKWSDQQFSDFISLKSANLVCDSISYPMYQGHYPHGMAFQQIKHDSFVRWNQRVKRLAPQTKTCVYFHCFIDAQEKAADKFPEARVLKPDGSHADYGQAFYGIFFPTLENEYGRAVRKNVDIILDQISADGVYWDEMEYSAFRYHYGQPWDGVSADIDPRTMKISRLKSAVALLSQPWRLALANQIKKRGPLIANGQPHTRTMAALKIPRFVETASVSNCAQAQLHSPIALGDHLTERSEADAYRNMVGALDWGCLSHWYADMQVVPQYPTLAKYMYPITPVELHEGFIIGRERVITNRSGLFGWGDNAAHEVHVFDESGKEASNFSAPTVRRDGMTFTEVRIARGWSAAIMRKG